MTNDDKQYVWIYNGQLTIGTLAHYADNWESSCHHELPISGSVWEVEGTHGLRMHKVHITFDGIDDNEYVNFTLIVYADTVPARIDGRA